MKKYILAGILSFCLVLTGCSNKYQTRIQIKESDTQEVYTFVADEINKLDNVTVSRNTKLSKLTFNKIIQGSSVGYDEDTMSDVPSFNTRYSGEANFTSNSSNTFIDVCFQLDSLNVPIFPDVEVTRLPGEIIEKLKKQFPGKVVLGDYVKSEEQKLKEVQQKVEAEMTEEEIKNEYY